MFFVILSRSPLGLLSIELSLNDFRAAELSCFNIPVTFLAFSQLAFSLAENCSRIPPLGVRTDDGIILTGSGSIAFVYSWSWLIGTLVVKAKTVLKASQCTKSFSNETFGGVLSFLYPFPFIYALTGWEKLHKIVHAWKRHVNIYE